jgi:hypothetical protein
VSVRVLPFPAFFSAAAVSVVERVLDRLDRLLQFVAHAFVGMRSALKLDLVFTLSPSSA